MRVKGAFREAAAKQNTPRTQSKVLGVKAGELQSLLQANYKS